MPEFSEIDRLSLDENAQVEGETAVAISRSILAALAKNSIFSSLLEPAIDTYRNRENLEMGDRSKEILAVGLAASMILLAATKTSFQFKGWDIEINVDNDAASPELVKELSTPLIKNLAGK